MHFAVMDTETTGLGDQDQVIEWALLTTNSRVIGLIGGGDQARSTRVLLEDCRCWLIKPTVPITPEARAVHHLGPLDLQDAAPMSLVVSSLATDLTQMVGVAHNVEFERRMLRQSGVPDASLPSRWICTWRCALHVWQDAPSHKLQVLRYWLDIYASGAIRGAHRAVADAIVTAALLSKLLQLRSAEELIRMTTLPVLQTKCRVGDYRGRPWSEVPPDMLRWVLRKNFDYDTIYTARHWLAKLMP